MIFDIKRSENLYVVIFINIEREWTGADLNPGPLARGRLLPLGQEARRREYLHAAAAGAISARNNGIGVRVRAKIPQYS